MAATKNVLMLGPELICRCGHLKRFSTKPSFWITSGSFRTTKTPGRFTKIANYYEKPKEKKGPKWTTWLAFGSVTAGLTGLFIGVYGRQDENSLKNDLYSKEPVIMAHIYRARDAIVEFRETFSEPSSYQLLPDPLPEPYVQPPYTLVLEMIDILVHPEYDRKSGWRHRKRPGIEKFLMSLAVPYFEIVVYTHENAVSYAPVVEGLDPDGYIMYRLFRDATKYLNGVHVKDLSCLNRDLSKVILLDCNSQGSQLQPRNSIVIKKWEGDPRDTTLVDLIPFFQAIGASGVEDVRDVLDFYRNEDDVVAAFRRNAEELRKQQEEQLASLQKRPGSWWSGVFSKRS